MRFRTGIFVSLIFVLVTNFSCGEAAKSITPTQVITPGGSTMSYTMDGNVKVFHINIDNATKTIYSDKIDTLKPFVKKHNRYIGPTMKFPYKKQIMKGFGYDGKIPGPTIIVNEGDHVRFLIKNNISEPSTIHWHGMIVPNDQDGTGGTADPVIEPGKTAMYEYTIVNPPGTYAYHSGFNDPKQVGMGLSGFLLVLPKDGHDDVKHDYAIMLHGWDIERSGRVNFLSMDNKWFTFNGLVAPNFPVIQIPYNAKVRFRFGNMGGIMAHPIHLHGYSFKITGTEGGPIPKSAQWPGATVAVRPGETRDIQFVANNPGLWRMHCHILHHVINAPPVYEEQIKKGKIINILPIGGMYTYFEVAKKPAS